MLSVLRFGIFTRLSLGFGVLCLLMLALTHQLSTNVSTINGDLGKINDVESVKQRLALNFRSNILDRSIAVRDVTLAKTDEEMDGAIEQVGSLAAAYAANDAQIRALVAANPETAAAEVPLLDAIAAVDVKIAPVVDRILSLQEVGGGFQARKVMREEARPLFAEWQAAIEKLIEHEEALNRTATDEIRSTVTGFTAYAWQSLAVAVGIALIAALFVSRSIIVPMRKLQRALQQMLDGRADGDLALHSRRDEIGKLARAFASVRDAVTKQAASQAEVLAERSLTEREQLELALRDRDAATRITEEAIDQLGRALEELANGNVSFRLDQSLDASFEPLRANFNMSAERFQSALGMIGSTAQSIDARAADISAASGNLAQRTEQQAASIEETAAALDEITANVSSSSRRTEEARSIAVQANASAAQSGKVVTDAVDAMQRIEQSSSQISNIIGVIDEIAFQTNLLALNAGVEAARAGDAGKGFAVVAQEVRELAQRSAKAAKEIKDLIRNSSVEVQSGVKLVRETGTALKTIEELVVLINDHMGAIATSAREQSVGLAEVNTAITQMDQATQKNAGMVEETAAASATLAGDLGQLQNLIAQFDLGQPDHSHGSQLRRTAAAMASRDPRPSPGHRSTSHGNASVKQEKWAEF